MTVAPYDTITLEQLQESGSVKWSMFPGTIGAFVAEMDFGIAPPVKDAVLDSIDRSLTGYLPPRFVGELGAAVSSWMTDRYGWDVPAEQIRPVPDVIAAFVQTIAQFSPPGSKVIVPTPAYMPFLSVPPQLGREVIQVPFVERDGRSVLDLDDLSAAFEAGGGLLVWCNPHNPLGTVSTAEEMRQVAEVVHAHGGRVFSDEIHAPMVYSGHRHVPYASVSPEAAAHTVTATSASKAWNLAGLKCAQIIFSNPADSELWAKTGFLVEHGASNQGVIANIAAFADSRDWLDDVVTYLDGNRQALRDLLAEHLPDAKYSMPEGTYIAWLDLRSYGIEGELGEHLREHGGVALSDGSVCGDVGAGHVRLIFATPKPVLEQAVLALKRGLGA